MIFKKQGFLQALGVFVYCSLIGVIFWKGNDIFGRLPNYFGPVLFLLLFSTSALICGAVVFYKPYKLFIENKKKEALNIVISTAFWLFFLLLIMFGVIIATR